MPKKEFIVKSHVNSFHCLYEDACHFYKLSNKAVGSERKTYCRTALLLYIISLEGLINRAIDYFLPRKIRKYFLECEKNLSMENKWNLLALLSNPKNPQEIDKSVYPWSHFYELIQIRNDFVHPKHNRPSYLRFINSSTYAYLDWKDIPAELNLKEKDIVYRQTRIPKDPYNILPEHVGTAKKVTDDTVEALDILLDGKLTAKNWLHTDKFELVYPPGATLKDVPRG